MTRATPSRPLVLVVGQPGLHERLSQFADLDVYPIFGGYEQLMAAMQGRTVPMHAHPTIIVCAADLPEDGVGVHGLLDVVADFMVVVGGTTSRSIPASATLDDLRDAIAATAALQGATLDAAPRDLRSVLGVTTPQFSAPRLANQINPATLPAPPSARRPLAVSRDALCEVTWRSDDQLAQLQHDLDSPAGLLAWVRHALRR